MAEETLAVVYSEAINGRRVLISVIPHSPLPYCLRIDGEFIEQCATKDAAIELGRRKAQELPGE